MKFQPQILHPTPDPFYVKLIKQIDASLRVSWGYDRYLQTLWAVERRIPPDRYYRMYRSMFENNWPRFIEAPVFDEDSPISDEDGNIVAYKQSGVINYDIAPEWEWVMFIEERDGSYRPLDQRVVTELKRIYAWERFHSLSRARFESARAREDAESKRKERRLDEVFQEFKDHRREIFKLPFVGQVGGFRATVGSTNKTVAITSTGDSE